MVNKIYFMFHPVCWAHAMDGDRPPPDVDTRAFLECLDWERQVNDRQRELISTMKSDEALVVFPVGEKQPMRDLEEYASSVLGARCVIVRRNTVAPPAAWKDLPDPIRRFLDDPDLQGKSDFLRDVPPEIQAELESEIREACEIHEYGWSADALKVVYFSRLAAMDILQEFARRGLQFDPATIKSEAFGEGFEQCAMTWKAMLVPYLGFKKPAENNFDLSVSGASILQGATMKERVSLPNDVRLFLWTREDGLSIGLYARAWCRLRDPQLHARLPAMEPSLELCDISGIQRESNKWEPEAPVLNAIRRDASDNPIYVSGRLEFNDFRQCLINADIVER